MRNVCGWTPASSAATEMMYNARSSWPTRLHLQVLARVAGEGRGERFQCLLLLVVELGGHVDVERHEEVARRALGRRDPTPLHLLRGSALGAALDLQGDRVGQRRH